MMEAKATISNRTAAYNGALIAIASVFAYSMTVMIYVVIRSSVTIYGSMPVGERGSILFDSGFSVAYSVTIFSLIMAVFSAVTGSVTAVVLKNFLLYVNPLYNSKKALLISSTIALSTGTLIYFFLRILFNDWMTFSCIETLLFWFLFPAILFTIACIISGVKLNKFLHTNAVVQNTRLIEVTTK